MGGGLLRLTVLSYDAISGAVVRAARRHGLSVPATETVHALLKLLDAHRG